MSEKSTYNAKAQADYRERNRAARNRAKAARRAAASEAKAAAFRARTDAAPTPPKPATRRHVGRPRTVALPDESSEETHNRRRREQHAERTAERTRREDAQIHAQAERARYRDAVEAYRTAVDNFHAQEASMPEARRRHLRATLLQRRAELVRMHAELTRGG